MNTRSRNAPVCVGCDSRYIASRANTRYCSQACRQAAYRHRKGKPRRVEAAPLTGCPPEAEHFLRRAAEAMGADGDSDRLISATLVRLLLRGDPEGQAIPDLLAWTDSHTPAELREKIVEIGVRELAERAGGEIRWRRPRRPPKEPDTERDSFGRAA